MGVKSVGPTKGIGRREMGGLGGDTGDKMSRDEILRMVSSKVPLGSHQPVNSKLLLTR